MMSHIQRGFEPGAEWCLDNNLSINVDKTKLMKDEENSSGPLSTVHQQHRCGVKRFKCIGVHMTDDLT